MCTGKYSRGLILRREVMGSCGLDWCTWIQGGMRSRGMEVRARCRVASTWTGGQAGASATPGQEGEGQMPGLGG